MDIQVYEKKRIGFRVAHLERRGNISEDVINEFLEKVADALCY